MQKIVDAIQNKFKEFGLEVEVEESGVLNNGDKYVDFKIISNQTVRFLHLMHLFFLMPNSTKLLVLENCQ